MANELRTQAAPARRDFAMMLQNGARERIKTVLPPGIDVERFIATAVSAYSRDETLQAATPESIIKALIKSAEIGLTPNTQHGHAYLVPFNVKKKTTVNGKTVENWVKEVQLVIGYKGYVYLASKYAGFKAVDSRVVYAKDRFRLVYTPEPELTHEPYTGTDDPGPETHFYAYGKNANGEILIEMMTRVQVERIRDSVKKGEYLSPAWKHNFDEMGKKTVLRRLLKDQPYDDRLASAFAYEDEIAATASIVQDEAKPTLTRSEALAAQLAPPPAAPVNVAPAALPATSAEMTDDELLDSFAGQDEPGSDG